MSFKPTKDSNGTSVTANQYFQYGLTYYFDNSDTDASNNLVAGGYNLSEVSDITSWDTSNVTDMSYAFANKASFNENLTSWNVENVTNMEHMFAKAKAFNNGDTSDIASKALSWKTGNVTDMIGMFWDAESFNQELDWDVSKVNKINYMFNTASAFNNGGSSSIGNWQINSNLTDIHGMFEGTAFDQDISTKSVTANGVTYTAWDVSNVTNMSEMFKNASDFNQDIRAWTVNVTVGLSDMFEGATKMIDNYGNTAGFGTTPLFYWFGFQPTTNDIFQAG